MAKNLPSPFTTDDLDSRNGFLTSVWGPSLWMTLHTISMNYPCQPTIDQKRQYKTFFDSLQHVLPCGKCRDNLVSNLATTGYSEEVFESRDTLSKWVYELHACVNQMLGKSTPLSYNKMRHTFEHFRARCGLDTKLPPTEQQQDPSKGRKGRTPSSKHCKTRGMKGGQIHHSMDKTRRHNKTVVPLYPSEDGCTVPITGIKSRCVIRIVPDCSRTKTLKVDKRCLCRRVV